MKLIQQYLHELHALHGELNAFFCPTLSGTCFYHEEHEGNEGKRQSDLSNKVIGCLIVIIKHSNNTYDVNTAISSSPSCSSWWNKWHFCPTHIITYTTC